VVVWLVGKRSERVCVLFPSSNGSQIKFKLPWIDLSICWSNGRSEEQELLVDTEKILDHGTHYYKALFGPSEKNTITLDPMSWGNRIVFHMRTTRGWLLHSLERKLRRWFSPWKKNTAPGLSYACKTHEKMPRIWSCSYTYMKTCQDWKTTLTKAKWLWSVRTSKKTMQFSDTFDCAVGAWPIKYLGVPVSGSRIRVAKWLHPDEKMLKRLDRWKAGALSMGGRLTLINSSMSSIPTYSMSMYLLL